MVPVGEGRSGRTGMQATGACFACKSTSARVTNTRYACVPRSQAPQTDQKEVGRGLSAYEGYAPAVRQSVLAVCLYKYLVDASVHTPQVSQSHFDRGTGASTPFKGVFHVE